MTQPRVVVTGATGLVGGAMVRHFGAVALTHADLDITDAAAVRRVLGKLRPELIINCAVLGVDACEDDPAAAQAVNVAGPAALAEVAERRRAAIVHFSSNYIFDGRERRLYTVNDDPNPVNEYGRTKLIGECAVLVRCRRAFIIRSSWIFGEGKESFISSVHRKLRAGKRVQAVSDVFASTTSVTDLVAVVAQIIERKQYGLHQVVNDGVCSNESFAREAARITGAREALIEPVSTRDVHHAPRPRYTPLRASTPLRDWREALREYILRDTGGGR